MTPTDKLKHLRAALDAWRERSAEVTVQLRSRAPQGTTTVNADADCAAAFALIDAMIRAAPALLDVVEAANELVEDTGIEMNDERMGYILAQVYRTDWQRMREALARLGEA